jgi:hypothetical protein
MHRSSRKDGNKIDLTSIGMPADFPQDLRNLVTFDGDVQNGLGAVPQQDGRNLCQGLGMLRYLTLQAQQL